MKTVIHDAWFAQRTKITIEAGDDHLAFIRCVFEGGEISIDNTINRTVFVMCLFQGTKFSGQALSPRIASECSWVAAPTETAAQS